MWLRANLVGSAMLVMEASAMAAATSLLGPAGVEAAEATTSFGRSIQSLKEALSTGEGQWQRISAHAEEATGRAFRGGTSIEEVFENTESGEEIVRHTIVRGEELLHETFRPYAKFGLE